MDNNSRNDELINKMIELIYDDIRLKRNEQLNKVKYTREFKDNFSAFDSCR